MANLHVTIIIRTTSPEGKRRWIKAFGKNDPAGPLYLRYCSGSKPRYIKAGNFYDEAEMAQMRLERKLKAQSLGFTVHEENADTKKFHRISDVIAAYLSDLRLNRRPEKTVKGRKTELEVFAKFSGKVYLEEITRADLPQSFQDYVRARTLLANAMARSSCSEVRIRGYVAKPD